MHRPKDTAELRRIYDRADTGVTTDIGFLTELNTFIGKLMDEKDLLLSLAANLTDRTIDEVEAIFEDAKRGTAYDR